MAKNMEQNRYSRLIETIFFRYFREGIDEIVFERDKIVEAAQELNITLPKNLGDVLYTFRYRANLPESITATAPDGYKWVIQPAGRSKYKIILDSEYKKIVIKTSSNTRLNIITWLHSRLFLLKGKFSFRPSSNLEEGKYIFIEDISAIPTGVKFNASMNGQEKLGEVEITTLIDDGNISITYRYPSNLSDFVINIILDMGIQTNILNYIPDEILNALADPEIPFEKASSTLGLELFFENVTVDQFCDWLIAESKDVLNKLFPALSWLLEIQPPKVRFQSNYERKIEMEGRLYKYGGRGTALFLPNPPSNQECITFEIRQLSSIRLRVLCKANKFAIEHFRNLLSKIEKNWPETKENIRRFLIDHIGENVVPVTVKLGPTVNIATGEILPEQEKYFRLEHKFKGTPQHFLAFAVNYGKTLSGKYGKDILELIGSSNRNTLTVQETAMFFPLDDSDVKDQKGAFGEIVVQALYDQSSILIVEVQRGYWDKVKEAWTIIFTELKRQGWILEEKTQTTDKNISLVSDVFISYSHKDREYAHKLAMELESNDLIPWIDDRIDYGTNWPQVVQDNLNTCATFVVIMSPNAYASTWVHNELSYAQLKKKPIFPLLLDGEVWVSLAATQYADVTDGKMPSSKFFSTIKKTIEREISVDKQYSEPSPISENIILKYYDMPSLSRVPPLRIEVENRNSQAIICKAIIGELVSFSPDDNVKKYLGSIEFFWKGDSKSLVKEKKIDAGTVGTVYLADISKEDIKDEFLYFVVQDEVNNFVKRFRKLGEYRIRCQIQATIGERQIIKEVDLTFEVVNHPKTKKRFIRTIQHRTNIPKGD